jgi:repressor LexA
MPGKLTPRQKQILDFIEEFIDTRGIPPTLREIGSHFNIRSTNGVNDHLEALKKKGYLERGFMKSRALFPIAGSGQTLRVPVLGRVPAGQPLVAVQEHEATVKVDRFFIGPTRDVYALKVQGDSMIEDGIHDGDYIFVTNQLQARPGEIVVAMIEGEATVKRYYPEGDRIRFQPANAAMDPIYVLRSEFRSVDLLGVVVGVYRRVK